MKLIPHYNERPDKHYYWNILLNCWVSVCIDYNKPNHIFKNKLHSYDKKTT